MAGGAARFPYQAVKSYKILPFMLILFLVFLKIMKLALAPLIGVPVFWIVWRLTPDWKPKNRRSRWWHLF